MEKPTEAGALRDEYLDLLKIMWVTCLKGIRRAKAHMVGTFLGMIVTQGALFAALFFVEDLDAKAVAAVLVITSLLTLWWFGTTTKEEAVHEKVKIEYAVMEERMKNIEREYMALTGTELPVRLQQTKFNKPLIPCSRNSA